jgi:hypothetical protein
MLLDALLNFVQQGAPLSIVGATGATFPSSVIDILGSGVGTAPQNIIGVQSTLFGSDTGVGREKLEILAIIGTAFTTSNASTLTVAFQGAPDTGAAGSYQPGTWQTFSQSAALTAAQLTAGQDIRMDWPVAFPDNENPRFLRLLFITPSGTAFTAGTVNFAVVTGTRDDQANKFAQRNYSLS